jgi:uncharacterized HhH-GPD family protein
MATTSTPASLPWTGDEEADRLLAADPMALLIGFVLDQQVPVPKAFSGPLALQRRVGTIDAGRLASMDPAKLEAAMRDRPAVHRFPGTMAQRVQALAAYVSEHYRGDAARVWTEAESGEDLKGRLAALPGIGDMKVRALLSLLYHQYGVRVPGMKDVLPGHPTLGEVTSPEELASYQAAKREHKARMRAQQG